MASCAGITLSVLGFAVMIIGLAVLAPSRVDTHNCLSEEFRSLHEERCRIAETYDSIGIGLLIIGSFIFVPGAIILLLADDYVRYTCPKCQITKRTFTWFLPKNCPSCGQPIEGFGKCRKRD